MSFTDCNRNSRKNKIFQIRSKLRRKRSGLKPKQDLSLSKYRYYCPRSKRQGKTKTKEDIGSKNKYLMSTVAIVRILTAADK
jgi:hypothetical protein